MPSKTSAELIYSVVKESLSAQQVQKATLESKASTLTGFAGGMIALLLGFKDNFVSLPLVTKYLVSTSIVLFLLSIFLATIVGWVRKYRMDPNPEAFAEHYIDKSEQDIKLQLIANNIGAWKSNYQQLERNAVLLRIALIAQTIAFFMLGIVLVWLLL